MWFSGNQTLISCVCCVRAKCVLILQETFNITPAIVRSIISVGCTRYLKLILINSLPVTLDVHGSNVFHCAAKMEASVYSDVVVVSQLLLFTGTRSRLST